MATKKYEGMRIMSLEGSVLYKNEGFTATKDGKPDPQAFRGILDESLDTLKLAEVYDRHEDEIGYPYLDGKKRFCRAVVNLSFNRAVKVYESCGNRYVLNGYRVTDEDMVDHICVCMVNGRPTLIAIEVSYKERKDYLPVEFPVSQELLGKYFKYDADTRSYKRSDKTMRKLADEGALGEDAIRDIMSEEKANQRERIIIYMDDIKQYYPRNMLPKDIVADIKSLLHKRRLEQMRRKENRDAR